MDMITRTLFLCLALALANGAPAHPDQGEVDVIGSDPDLPERCDGIEFDAVVPDEKGNTLFFKGPYLWNGYRGQAQRSNETFKELDDDHNIGHVDAAFRMHHKDNPDDHDHIYFFLDDKVFSYYNHSLEDGYPKPMEEDFPGIPSHLDAAVECPKGECPVDTVLFFKGSDVYVYDITTKTVKTKTWPHLPACTSVLRWMEHYYCFHGHNFTRFHPRTGEVSGGMYPKDARNYFMKCPNFGHGGGHGGRRCSDFKIDAITTDDDGKSYLFRGSFYMRLDTHRDGLHAFYINRTWPAVHNGVDAVFSYGDKMYLIKDDNVYIYRAGATYTLIDGYPKTLKEELGIEGQVDAAFVCPSSDTAHIIQKGKLRHVDLTATPRVMTREVEIPLDNIDAALCGAGGINVFQGAQYFHYESVMIMSVSKMAPVPQPVTSAMVGCQD